MPQVVLCIKANQPNLILPNYLISFAARIRSYTWVNRRILADMNLRVFLLNYQHSVKYYSVYCDVRTK